MKKYSELFIAFDTAKKKHAVAVADVGREGEIRYLGEIDSSSTAIEKVLGKLAQRYTTLRFAMKPVRRGMGCTARFAPWVTNVPSSRPR